MTGTAAVDHIGAAMPIALLPLTATTYYQGDHLGTSRKLLSSNGYPIWEGTFLPFGQEWNPQTNTNRYKFTSKERDGESGLDYFGPGTTRAIWESGQYQTGANHRQQCRMLILIIRRR